jgi:hypothetical protein
MRRLTYLLLAVTALSWGAAVAHAASDDDPAARLAAIERENAILRKENAALRERGQLQSENTRLRERVRAPEPSRREWSYESSTAAAQPAAQMPPAVAAVIADPRAASAYMADSGLPVKAPLVPIWGEFKFFVEGGAFWTGGDPARTLGFPTAGNVVGVAPGGGPFDLTPRLGWDAAVGFDYRFAGTPWHVSAQFRYGEAKKSDSDSSSFGPALVNLFPVGAVLFNVTSTAQTTAANRETHWLADFAIGRDVFTIGPDAMQVKVGVRVVELASSIRQVTNTSFAGIQFPSFLGGFFTDISNSTIEQVASFRGAGPRVGVEGAIPLPAGWEFDYLAGAAVLFGTRRFEELRTSVEVVTSNVVPSGTDFFTFRSTDQKGAVVGNVDLQAGFAYWVTPNFRVNASYRLDAYFGAIRTLDVAGNQRTVDRYFHGPRIAGTVRF